MSLLNKIVERKRSTIASLKPSVSTPTTARLPFAERLTGSDINIIGEIKPKSPSCGNLLDIERLDQVLNVYEKHCSAISVLTDEEFFGGSFDLLARVAERVSLPILCKDFIISARQIDAAKQSGASAVLLVAKIVTVKELGFLINRARQAGLAPVVEVNDASEVKAIDRMAAEVVLINNRNLQTMDVNLDTTKELAELLSVSQIKISASGIKTRDDIEKLIPYTSNFLIGTSLMQSADPESLLFSLKSSRFKSLQGAMK